MHLARYARGFLAFLVLGGEACRGGGAPPSDEQTETTPTIAEAWVTTGDRTRLLARGPNAPISVGDQAGVTAAIDVDTAITYQEIVGFRAAITDASAWLIQTKLSPAQRTALLQDLFGRTAGIGLSLTRLTIGASDFSRSHYSFDDVPAGEQDPTLARFSIEPNRADVLPVVKRALAINPSLAVMASPWSAPAWMKTTGSLIKGTLRRDAYPAFAEYLRRYIQTYEGEGVPIFAITIQNEPHFEPDNYPGMRLTPAQRADFVGHHLGPLFETAGIRAKILDWDHKVTRNEEYYALAHASRFVRPRARRIASTTGVDGLDTVAFRNADDGSKVLVVVNTAPVERTFAVRSGGRSFRSTLPAGAVMTLRWR